MPYRWRLQLAGLAAFVALISGAALVLFQGSERLDLPLGLVLLGASILAALNLFRWCTKPLPLVALTSTRGPRRPLALWWLLPWFFLQVGALGFCAWIWANDTSPDRPPLGLALLLGTALAVVLTALPFIIMDVIIGQWRLWSDKWRNRKRQRPTRTAPEPQQSNARSTITREEEPA